MVVSGGGGGRVVTGASSLVDRLNRQTQLKTLLSGKLRMQAVIIHTFTCLPGMINVGTAWYIASHILLTPPWVINAFICESPETNF